MIIDPTSGVKCPSCRRNNFAFREHCMNCGHPFVPVQNPEDELDRMRGAAVSVNPETAYLAVVRGPWIEDNHERAERVNGHLFCEHCGLAWPFFEEVEEWTEGKGGVWFASGWGMGQAYCLVCEAVYIEDFEGCFELKKSEA